MTGVVEASCRKDEEVKSSRASSIRQSVKRWGSQEEGRLGWLARNAVSGNNGRVGLGEKTSSGGEEKRRR